MAYGEKKTYTRSPSTGKRTSESRSAGGRGSESRRSEYRSDGGFRKDEKRGGTARSSAGREYRKEGERSFSGIGRTGGRTGSPERKDSRSEAIRRKERPREEERDDRKASYQDYEYRDDTFPAAAEEEDRSSEYILTGRNPIREALKNNRDLEKLLVQKGELSGSAMEIVKTAKDRKILVQVVEKSRLDEITPRHQGLIAFASAYQYSTVEDILEKAKEKGEDPFILLLDGITDPHNLGAIIRTAECVGAHGVIVPQHRNVGLTPAAVKASAGAVEYIPIARVTNLNRTIEELQKKNIWVYALSMNGTDYEEVDFEGGTALVIGAEGEGISRLTEEKCDLTVSLPMNGHLDSLNASVAAGIMMYRVMSFRKGSIQR